MNLWTDPWIDTDKGAASLSGVVDRAGDYGDIIGPPMARLAILRLMLGCCDVGAIPIDGFELDRFLQVRDGWPAKTVGRHPYQILSMVDDSSMALSPVLPEITPAMTAQALVVSYFCDRAGLKSSYPGASTSGQSPLCMGKVIGHPWGDTLADFVGKNRKGINEPWWELDYDNPDRPGWLWPWRRLRVMESGYVAIAAGAKYPSKEDLDPWALGSATMKVLRGDEVIEGDGIDCTAIVLNKAKLLGSRQWKQ